MKMDYNMAAIFKTIWIRQILTQNLVIFSPESVQLALEIYIFEGVSGHATNWKEIWQLGFILRL